VPTPGTKREMSEIMMIYLFSRRLQRARDLDRLPFTRLRVSFSHVHRFFFRGGLKIHNLLDRMAHDKLRPLSIRGHLPNDGHSFLLFRGNTADLRTLAFIVCGTYG
jgi:hypothetical protein